MKKGYNHRLTGPAYIYTSSVRKIKGYYFNGDNLGNLIVENYTFSQFNKDIKKRINKLWLL